jgi:septal ring factor EnvC (AmiA/AmiB activator)
MAGVGQSLGLGLQEFAMFFKLMKLGVLTVAGAALLGAAVFGRDVISYATSGARSIRSSVTDNVPVEFQLRRARDLVDDIVPEMQANIRLIAQQEVEIANLKEDIGRSTKSIGEERACVGKLRDAMNTTQTSYTFNSITYSRDQLKDDLAHRFDQLREADVVLTGKQRLLENRQRSLAAAAQTLERTRSQKTLLESQISALDSQNQLVRAQAIGSGVQIDSSKLAQTEKLIAEIKKQLDISERVLAHEASFTQPIKVDVVDEKDLMTQVDDYLGKDKTSTASAQKN